ncbi:FAD:protein FMN transferase [Butyrivibrio sp. AE3004]|uniref:FAD:protein FMN transferase n=1 Tax=Butyrivibrio sp. AE3004 TaxID=1506994 RepID=UPI000493B830|nr:FAD:protein FMN transferase [Butyrivibrio sp. AE3004]
MISKFKRARRFLRAIIILLIISLHSSITGCSKPSDNSTSQKVGFYFDTVVSLTAYNKDFISDDSNFFTKNSDAEKKCSDFLDDCLTECSHYENLFSASKEGSDIWNINNAHGKSVEVDSSTYQLIEKALYYSALTDGLFDPTIGIVTNLWNFHADSDKSIPDDKTLNDALLHVDYKTIKLSRSDNKYFVQLTDPEARIDLGGIAKGFIADKLKEFYKEKGAISGIINLGGNVLLVGQKPGTESSFSVGIQKPFGNSNEPILTLSLNDRSLVTSGIYDRFFEKDGIIYHHILDPATGFPIKNNIYSATIVSESSVDGDALSTICFSLGTEKGMELIESIPDTYVLFVTNDYEIVYSDGFPGIKP